MEGLNRPREDCEDPLRLPWLLADPVGDEVKVFGWPWEMDLSGARYDLGCQRWKLDPDISNLAPGNWKLDHHS